MIQALTVLAAMLAQPTAVDDPPAETTDSDLTQPESTDPAPVPTSDEPTPEPPEASVEPVPETVAAPTVAAAEPAETPVAEAPEANDGWGDDDFSAGAAEWGEFAAEPEGEKIFQVRLYGFIDAYAEKVAKTPAGVDSNGETVFEENPYEFDVPNVNLMVQGSIYQRFRFFLNLAAPGSGGESDTPIGVRNAWVEAGLFRDYLALRAGKLYRRFGLYNEILDAVPTFIGIEPPELFDNDHLMVTRTTNLMLFGRAALGNEGGVIANYAVTTGNDERADKAVPIGADLNFEFNSWLTLGSSFYHSGGPAGSTVSVGEGSPRGGVLPWMARDEYYIIGGYAQVQRAGATLQGEYWEARHRGERDEDALATLATEATLSPRQLRRFYAGGDPTAAARLDARYTVRTAYLRFGWQFPFAKRSSITPYIQGDYYSNPETIAQKSYGGDNEAGLADDGSFQKYTAGLVIRPVPQVALKLDGSTHVHTYNGAWLAYPEGRISFSYLWELPIGN